MLKTTTFVLAAATALLSAGCLRSETRHVLYVAPEGAVTWTATQSEVRSDETDRTARAAEEAAFLAAVRAGQHLIAQGLQALDPIGEVRTTVVRGERPFVVVTEARYDRLDRVLQRLFLENGFDALVTSRGEDARTILHARIDFASSVDAESPASALLEDLETLALVLTDGRVVEAVGFDISQDGRTVRFSKEWLAKAEAAYGASGTVEFELTWTSGQ